MKEGGVDFIRAEVIEILQSAKGLDIKYKAEDGRESVLTVDMVVLNPALEPAADSAELSRILDIPRGQEGFFIEREPGVAPVVTARDGIFVAGCARDPKDIAETIAEAEATVGRVLLLSDRGYR